MLKLKIPKLVVFFYLLNALAGGGGEGLCLLEQKTSLQPNAGSFKNRRVNTRWHVQGKVKEQLEESP